MVSTSLRVLAAAFLLSAASFAAGIAGDLSVADPPRSGESVVLRIPPPIPADAPRAAPLPVRALALRAPRTPAAAAFAGATSAATLSDAKPAAAPHRGKAAPKPSPTRQAKGCPPKLA